MPTISCFPHDLAQLTKKGIRNEKLLSLFNLAKAEFDGEDGDEWRIELQDTNRPDLWCTEGIARQFKTFLTEKVPAYPFFTTQTATEQTVEVDPKLEEIRPVVGAFIARGVKVDNETLVQIIQTQEKLCEGYGHQRREAAMGVYDASAIKFPVHYRAVKPKEKKFVPLGFEEEMDLDAILAQHPKGQHYGHLIQGKPYYPILEDAEGMVLSLPPVINSRALGEVQIGDDNLFIEVTGYKIELVTLVLNIMAVNLADRGWEIVPVCSNFPYDTPLGRNLTIPYPLERKQEVTPAEVKKYLGLDLTGDQVCSLLTKYGITAGKKKSAIEAVCPPYRFDYMHPCDVIEDIAIAYGFNNFELLPPERFTVGGLSKQTLFSDRVRQELVGYGFQEVFSNVLLSREEVRNRFKIPDDSDLVEIDNFVSETYSVIRDRLLAMLLRVESKSTKALYPHAIFEVGEVAVFDPGQNHGSSTEEHTAALIASKDAGFSDIHAYLDALLYFLAKEYTLKAETYPYAIEGRSAAIFSGEKKIGEIAELHPEVLEAWGIEVPVCMFEINLNLLRS